MEPMYLNDRDFSYQQLEFPGWIALLITLVSGFGVFVVLNYLSLRGNNHNGKPGISRFRQVILGDSILLPAIAYFIADFYQNAEVEEGVWLNAHALPVVTFFAAGVFSFGWVTTAMNHPIGDWTTTKGGINIYGLYHFIFYWSQSYIWLLFGILSFGYMVTQDGENSLWINITVAGVLMFAHVIVLGILDARSEPKWLWNDRFQKDPRELPS